MGNKLDSTSLFVSQVSSHSNEMSRLLALVPQEPIDGALIDRCAVSTAMLASSASLMDLPAWNLFLVSLEQLLRTYEKEKRPWDEGAAQVISELLDKEDQLVADAGGNLMGVVSTDELDALKAELDAVYEQLAAASGDQVNVVEPSPAANDATNSAGSLPVVDVDQPLGKSMGELRHHMDSLIDQWKSCDWENEMQATEAFDGMRGSLRFINFFASSMERIIGIGSNYALGSPETLVALTVALEDFSRLLCAGSSRRIDVSFIGPENKLDARLFESVERVLQCTIHDIYLRCEDQYLRVEVTVENKWGALQFTLRDNGSNFITDSGLDPDEYLAFYPRLKETRKILSELGSVLSVEPDENHDTRFTFSIPSSKETNGFVLWRQGAGEFAVLSHQLNDVIGLDELTLKSDNHGESLMMGGKRVPVLRLGQICNGAPSSGDRIAIIGSLEKRVGLYVTGDGFEATGSWEKDAIPVWRGLGQGVAQIDHRKVSLIDADSLLQHYVAVINDVGDETISGGVVAEDNLSETQVNVEKVAPSPPEAFSAQPVEVLVVENNEELRNTLATILAEPDFHTTIFAELDQALEFVQSASPSLIISEFRMPTMAAKALAESLKGAGKQIPVVVSTSHQGEIADLLVEKLEIAGYINKPLEPEKVLRRIRSFLAKPMATPQVS